MSHNIRKPFTARFLDDGGKVFLELANTTEEVLKGVEVLAIFLKDLQTPGGPSRSQIKFARVKSVKPGERAILSHRTWIDGKPAGDEHDELERLKVMAGEDTPYVLDISWEDGEGKMRYQRIPVGH